MSDREGERVRRRKGEDTEKARLYGNKTRINPPIKKGGEKRVEKGQKD